MPGVDSLDVRAFWPSTHASIPSGWSRDTDCDEKFLQGDDSGFTGAANAGGSHSHTNSHTHTGDQHRHTFDSDGAATAWNDVMQTGSSFPFAVKPGGEFNVHSHNLVNTAYATITYPNATVTISTENDAQPPYKKLIVIKPNAVTDDLPDDVVCYTDETSLPTGFVKYTPLDDHFIQGPSTGADADLTSRGSTTHGHTASDHDHDVNNHNHSQTPGGTSNPHAMTRAGFDVDVYKSVHHNVGFGLTALSDLTDASLTVTDGTFEPAYTKLLGIQNTSGSPTTPVGVIVAFVGAYADIPSNWQLCNGVGDTVDCTNTQIKSTPTDGQIGVQAGGNAHTHTIAGTHGHTHGTHNHTQGSVGMIGSFARATGFPTQLGIPVLGGIHTHVWTINITTPTLQNASVTLDNADGRPAYRTVVWIKKMIERPGVRGLLGATF